MSGKKYYLGFATSTDLEGRFQSVLEHSAQAGSSSLLSPIESSLELFVPELLQSFLVDTADMLQLSSWARKMVHSTADVIRKTSLMLIPKLLKKRSNEELQSAVEFTRDIYLPGSVNNHESSYAGSEIDAATFARFERIMRDIDAGKTQEVQQDLIDAMPLIVDTLVDGFMKRSINTVERSFVTRKLADGAIATCRAAGHGVVNKVFKDLTFDQYPIVADFLRSRLVYVTE